MPRPRHEQAQCSICMDGLFDALDDLDEILPIATPDCGHVFHEKCLMDWFASQASAYIATMSDQGADVTSADAPAECPECRTECFADVDTGKPDIHRLYINFTSDAGGGGFASSQHVPSSPASARWRSADKDVLGLARRARGLGAEVDAHGADSLEDDVRGTLRRAETLREDAVSAKAAKGFKDYIGGLNRAINKLTARLEEHPLIPSLEGRIRSLEEKLVGETREKERAIRDVSLRLNSEMQVVVERERRRAAEDVKRANAERDTMQRQVEKTKVTLQHVRKAAGEREAALEAKVAEAERLRDLESATRKEVERDLADRTRTLKIAQAKADRRSDLKRRIDELEAQNRALLANRVVPPPQPAPAGLHVALDPNYSAVDDAALDSRASPDPEPLMLSDDLVIDDPPGLDSLLGSMKAERARSTTGRTFALDDDPVPRSTTARTFSLPSAKPQPKPKPMARTASFGRAPLPFSGSPKRKATGQLVSPSKRAKVFDRASLSKSKGDSKQSKYFSNSDARKRTGERDRSLDDMSAELDRDGSVLDSPPRKPANQSPFNTAAQAAAKKAEHARERKRVLDDALMSSPHLDLDAIYVPSSSPGSSPVRKVPRLERERADKDKDRAKGTGKKPELAQPRYTDFLKGGLSKGVALGAKARRRA